MGSLKEDSFLLSEKVSSDWFRKYSKAILFFILVSIPLFIHLEKLPIRLWDESRLAINAYEMYHNGNWLVTTFNSTPDLWNTKPPFMIWLQVICMKIFGISELGLRLPSALAGFLTIMLLMLFLRRWLNSFWPGFIASLMLITSYGYVNIHVTRTGDYDSLLILFLTAGAFSFYNYLESPSRKHLLLSGLFLWLGIMTKGVHGLLFLPGLFILAIVQKQVKSHLFNRNFLLTFSGVILLAAGYYAIREQWNPGYLNAVWHNEIMGRYFEVRENNKGDIWYYYDMLSKHHYTYWFWLIPCGLIAGVFSRETVIRKITWFSFIILVSYGLIISLSKTKLEWYEAPMFPFMAVLIAAFVYQIFILLKKSNLVSGIYVRNVLPYIFLFILFYHPYQATIDKVYFPKESGWDIDTYRICYFLEETIAGKHDIDGYILFFKGYHAHLLFYKYLLAEKGIDITIKENPELKKGDNVIVTQPATDLHITECFEYETLLTDNNLKVYRIIAVKQNKQE